MPLILKLVKTELRQRNNQVTANLALIIVMCLLMQSCAISIAGLHCQTTALFRLDNEHISKRSVTNFGHMAATGLDCPI